MYYTKEDIARLISEDMPYFDLTSKLLNIDNPGKISFYTRKDAIISGNKLVELLCRELDLKINFKEKDSKFITADNKIFEAEGENVLILWKVAQNIYEYAMSVSSYTYEMVKKAKDSNPDIEILTTRKIIPFTKKIALNAIMDGGAMPHRITTSETILVFDNYIKLFGGWDKFFREFEKLKYKTIEKKWVVETDDLEMAKRLIAIEVDVIQLDKVDVETTKEIVELAHKRNIKVLSAGGININNVEDYAKTGVNSIVTTAPYFAKEADVKVVIDSL